MSPVLLVKAPGSKPASGRALHAHTHYPALRVEQQRRQEGPREKIYPSEHPEHTQAFPKAPKFLLLYSGNSWEWIPLNDTELQPLQDLQIFSWAKSTLILHGVFPEHTDHVTHGDSQDVICHFRGTTRAKNSRKPEQHIPLGALQLCSSLRPVIFTPFLTTLHSDNSIFPALWSEHPDLQFLHCLLIPKGWQSLEAKRFQCAVFLALIYSGFWN